MKVLIALDQPTMYQPLLLQAVMHFFSRDAQFAGSTLYCHNGEMDMSVCLIVCVCHIFTFRCLSSLLWGFLVQEVSGLLGLRSLALDDLHYRQLVALDAKADVVVGEGEAVEAGGVVVVVGPRVEG